MRSFDTWTYEEVEDTFGLTPLRSSALFEEWLAAEGFAPNTAELASLDDLKELLFDEAKNWNEDELKLFFIGPLLSLIHFKTPYFKPYTQRTLTLKSDTIAAYGKVDFMLAKGKVLPKIPFFCSHVERIEIPLRGKYKQENRRDNDPLGQLLIGMVAAQSRNEINIPIFGTYISGRNWFFVLLDGKNYCLSNAYNGADNDVYIIFNILKKCKDLVGFYAKQAVKE